MYKATKRLMLIAMASVLAFVANAYDFKVDGICYNINGNEATVTYNDYYLAHAEIHYNYYTKYTGHITIPESVTHDDTIYSVTSIGGNAFSNCSGLTSVNIPNSVSTIDERAFYECSGLTSVNIPNSVTFIGDRAFAYCSGLTSVNIPNSVTTIYGWAFRGCSTLDTLYYNAISCADFDSYFRPFDGVNLKTIIIGNNVKSIPAYLASEMTNLASVNIPNSVTYIGNGAFDGTAWYTNQPDGLVYAGMVAYKYKGTMPEGTSITFEEGTLGIAGEAFKDCSGLTSVNIPNSVSTIGNSAFDGCSGLRESSISFPESVRSIGTKAFYNTYLSEISFESDIYLDSWAFCCDENAGNIRLAFYGNINKSIGSKVFWHYNRYTGATQRYISQLILGEDVDSIKGMNIKPGDEIFSYNPVPPVADENTFLSYGSTTVHVPATSLAAYFTAPYWSNFANIVGDAVTLEEVTIDKDSVEVNLGTQFNLIATISPSNATTSDITWRTTNNKVATVNNGLVSAIGVGECHIIAQCLNKKAICHVVVNDTTVTITLDQHEAMVLPNHIVTLTPSASPVMPDLAVSSSDPTIAAARLMNGKVQVVGIKEGTTTITVDSTDGKAVPATCLVTVYTEPGDVNMDGFVNISDVTQMIDYLLGSEVSIFKEANADLNGDDSVTIGDVTALIDLLLSAGN